MVNTYSVLMVLLVTGIAHSHAQWIPLLGGAAREAAPTVTLLEDDARGAAFRVDVDGFAVREFVADGITYRTPDLLTETVVAEPGMPEVPYVSRIFAVLDKATVSVEVVEMGRVEMFRGFSIPPARMSWKEGDPEPPYVARGNVYASVTPVPGNMVKLDPPGVFRDFRIVRVAVYPIQYVPATGEVQVTSSVVVRLRYTAEGGENQRTAVKKPIAPSFDAVYRNVIFNYESVLEREYNGMVAGRDVMLAIMPDTYVATFNQYKEWKHASGIYTHVTKFSDIGANSTNPDIIKNHVAQAYHTWDFPPTYVLLVGDYGQVPIKLVSYDYTFANEDFFVEIDGNDHFPEAMIGRFTNQTDYTLQVLISKAMRYEQTPYRASTDWFKKAAVASNNAYESQIKVKRFARDVMMLDGGFTQVDTFYNSSPCGSSLSTLISTLNSGRSYLNYRGEGWSSGWWASCYNFQTSDVSSVNNGQMLTFVTSIGCGVAMFNVSGGNCFGEQWLELGTPTSPRGACAFVGPTSNTHTTYNNKIDKGIYVGMFQEGLETPGQALLRGKLYMFNVYGTDHWVEYHYRVYCVLGDPSIHVWRNVPAPVTVTYPAQLPVGYNQVECTVVDSATGVPVQGAQVVFSGLTVYATGVTGATGTVRLSLTPEAIDTLSLVVRGGTVVPKKHRIPVLQTPLHVAPYGTPAVVDLDGNLDGLINPNETCRITFSLKNWGTQTAFNVQASLSVEDTNMVRVVTTTPIAFGDIASGQSTVGSPMDFFVKPECPVGYPIPLVLRVTSGPTEWQYIEYEEVMGCRLSYQTWVVNDQGSQQANHRMDPGETVKLFLTVGNIGEDVAPGVRGILRSSDPYMTISDSTGYFGTIPMQGSAANAIDYFVVTVSDTCPRMYNASFSVLLYTEGGRYPYSVVQSFRVPVAVPEGTDPTGPDTYGYYMYTSDDSLYDECPAFEWFEIDGIGTQIPRNPNGDFTQTVTLPFTFKYYGVNYTQARLNSDGWIAFGSGTQVAWQNYALPHNDAINCMVAPYWDDLFSTNAGETGKLLYYSDPPNHRFIVEWFRAGHYGNYQDRETFQLILFDPAHVQTPTGDGVIVFQYDTVSEASSCTIGLENHTQTVGMSYLYNDQYDTTATALRDGFAIKLTTAPPHIRSNHATVSVPIAEGWNLISNPVERPVLMDSLRQLFPASLFPYAFAFTPTGYVMAHVLERGSGYWGKFPGNDLNEIVGISVEQDTFQVRGGWNVVGSISVPVDTAAVASAPTGLRASPFFAFAGGYQPSTTIEPGRGYWVKCTGNGSLILSGSSPRRNTTHCLMNGSPVFSTLTVRDANDKQQVLLFMQSEMDHQLLDYYEMPPSPPDGVFDVRFRSGRMLEIAQGDSSCEFPISLRDAAYPVRIAWDTRSDGSSFVLKIGGREIVLIARGSVLIENEEGPIVLVSVAGKELPMEFALGQNYPNPFNPTTIITYALPVDSHVSLRVYNVLGQEVCVLADGMQEAGYKTVEWDSRTTTGAQSASGVYFIRLDVQGVNGVTFLDVRKMLLMK